MAATSSGPALSLSSVNPDKFLSLPGTKCAYCGKVLAAKERTKDHLVGRRFVPEGTLTGAWNALLNVCRPCNDKKARLEDDISTITMLPDTAGKYARDDERLRRTLARKAKGSFSVATKKLAAQSYKKLKANLPVTSSMSLSYDGVAMPDIEDQRAGLLAHYHAQGFWFLRTFSKTHGHGSWLDRSKFMLLGQFVNDDWGNPIMRHFADTLWEWEPLTLCVTADGYFRHVMRKSPQGDLYGWAVEWNDRLRVIGIYGEPEDRDRFLANVPAVVPDLSYGDTNFGFVYRVNTPLGVDGDSLFALPDGFTGDEPYGEPHWR